MQGASLVLGQWVYIIDIVSMNHAWLPGVLCTYTTLSLGHRKFVNRYAHAIHLVAMVNIYSHYYMTLHNIGNKNITYQKSKEKQYTGCLHVVAP